MNWFIKKQKYESKLILRESCFIFIFVPPALILCFSFLPSPFLFLFLCMGCLYYSWANNAIIDIVKFNEPHPLASYLTIHSKCYGKSLLLSRRKKIRGKKFETPSFRTRLITIYLLLFSFKSIISLHYKLQVKRHNIECFLLKSKSIKKTRKIKSMLDQSLSN